MIVCLLHVAFISEAVQAEVVPYPRVPGDRSNPDFPSVKVDGVAVETVSTDMNVGYAHFAFSGEVGVAVAVMILGFLTLLMSAVPGVQDFGVLLAIGAAVLYVVSLFVLNAFLFRFDRQPRLVAAATPGGDKTIIGRDASADIVISIAVSRMRPLKSGLLRITSANSEDVNSSTTITITGVAAMEPMTRIARRSGLGMNSAYMKICSIHICPTGLM